MTSDEAWEDWILFVLDGIRQTARDTIRKIDAINELQEHTRQVLRTTMPGGLNADLLNVLFEQPYCRIATVVARCGVSRPTATAWLNTLVSGGILGDAKIGRDRLFINQELVEVFTRNDDLTGLQQYLSSSSA